MLLRFGNSDRRNIFNFIYLIFLEHSLYNKKLKNYTQVQQTHSEKMAELKVSKELNLMQTTLKLSNSLKSNKDHYGISTDSIKCSNQSKFDQVEYNGSNLVTIRGLQQATNILKFIENLGSKKWLIKLHFLNELPQRVQGGATMKGFRIFVKVKNI